MKIGIPVDCFGDGLDSDVREKVLAVAEVLKGRGAQVEECQAAHHGVRRAHLLYHRRR